MESFFFGRAKIVITPNLGCELAGFAARKGTATSVHDDLFVRAIVISDTCETVVLVSLDLIGITQEFTDSVRNALQQSRQISPKNIILCATHTHCGPVTIRHFFNPDQPLNLAYLTMLRERIVTVVEEAYDGRERSVIRAGMVRVTDVAVNRRNEDGKPIDEYAGILLVEDLQGKATSILVNYACHPTALGPDTLEITRDFPHYLHRSLSQRLGEEVISLYFNGAEGDLSVGHKSCDSVVKVDSAFRTYQRAQEIGERLADQVLRGIPTLVRERPELACEYTTIALPLKTYGSLADVRKIREDAERTLQLAEKAKPSGDEASMELLQKRRNLLFARIDEYYASMREKDSACDLPIEVAVLRIGETALVSIPGEIFVEIGLVIQNRSPFPRTMVLGLAGDYIGYVPTVEEAERAGYEVVASQVQPVASRLIEEGVGAALQRAFRHTEKDS